MSENKHTPEPWIAVPGGRHDPEMIITTQSRLDQSKGEICGMDVEFTGQHGEEQKANYRRIVACVNACAGIDIAALEIIHSNGPYPESDLWMRNKAVQAVQMYKDAAKQRDAAIAAERVWESSMMKAVGEDGPGDVVKAIEAIKRQRDELQTKANAMAETINAIAGLCTYQHESKEDFIGRVRAVLGDDPDLRVSSVRKERDDLLEQLKQVEALSEVRLSQRDELLAALELMLERISEPPEANCSCHLSPPCADCIDFGGEREAFEEAKSAIARAKGGAA